MTGPAAAKRALRGSMRVVAILGAVFAGVPGPLFLGSELISRSSLGNEIAEGIVFVIHLVLGVHLLWGSLVDGAVQPARMSIAPDSVRFTFTDGREVTFPLQESESAKFVIEDRSPPGRVRPGLERLLKVPGLPETYLTQEALGALITEARHRGLSVRVREVSRGALGRVSQTTIS